LLSSRQIFRYAVPARTVTKIALVIAMKQWANWSSSQLITGRTGHFVYIYTALLTISELSSFSCFLTRHYYVISHFTLTGAQTVFKVSYNLSTIEPAVVVCLFQLSKCFRLNREHISKNYQQAHTSQWTYTLHAKSANISANMLADISDTAYMLTC